MFIYECYQFSYPVYVYYAVEWINIIIKQQRLIISLCCRMEYTKVPILIFENIYVLKLKYYSKKYDNDYGTQYLLNISILEDGNLQTRM